MCSPPTFSRLFGALRRSGVILCLLVGLQTGVVRGHNLDAEVDYLGFDSETIAALQARAVGGQPLLQLGDTVGLL